jgi:hypothetical protein
MARKLVFDALLTCGCAPLVGGLVLSAAGYEVRAPADFRLFVSVLIGYLGILAWCVAFRKIEPQRTKVGLAFLLLLIALYLFGPGIQ